VSDVCETKFTYLLTTIKGGIGLFIKSCFNIFITRNSSGDEIANVNFLYNDILPLTTKYNRLVHKFCHRSTQEHRFAKFSEITQCNSHYAVQGHSRSPILVPIESSHTTSY